MRTFTDSTGRQWLVEFDTWGARAVQKQTGHDLFDENGIVRMMHPVGVAEILYVLCADEMHKLDCDEAERERAWHREISGRTYEAARDALYYSWCDWWPEERAEALRAEYDRVQAKTAEDVKKKLTATPSGGSSGNGAGSSVAIPAVVTHSAS